MRTPDRATLEEAEREIQAVAREVKKMCPEGWGFFLVMASFGEDGISTYMSSLGRDGAVKLLREMADKLEDNEPHI